MDHSAAAVCYNEISAMQQQKVALGVLEIISPQKGDTILDLGCGTGQLCKALLERVGPEGKIVAVDPDEDRIKLAREIVIADNIQFMVACDKDFPEGQYDMIIATSVIHWIDDKEGLFKKVFDNLKPGGKFGFTTYDDPVHSDVFWEMFNLLGPEIKKDTVDLIKFKSASYYKQLGKSAGFEMSVQKNENVPITVPNIDVFIKFFYGVYHGRFDCNSPLLQGLRQKYEGQSFHYVGPELTMVFIKQ